MPIFEFEKPDGTIVEVDAPTQEAALAGFRNAGKPRLSGNPLKAAGQLVVGAFDLAGGGVDSLATGLQGVAMGTAGAINPNDTYLDAAARAPRFRDPGPVSTGGKVIADKLGTALSYTGIPQVLEGAGNLIEDTLGPEARHVAGVGAEAAATFLPGARVPVRAAAPLSAAAGRAVEAVQRAGFHVPPHRPTGAGGAVAGTPGQNTRASLATHEINDAKLAVANQDVTHRWATRAVNIPEASPEAVARAVKEAELPYDEMRAANLAVFPDQQLLQDAMALGGGQGGPGVRLPVDDAVQRLQTAILDTKRHSTGSIIDNVRTWRRDGFRNLGSEDVKAQTLGEAQLAAADALDGLLDRSLQRAAQMAQGPAPTLAALYNKLHADYVSGRARRADLHVLEDAMNAAGEINAQVIHRIGQRRRLNPFFQEIARAYDIMPGAMAPVARASRTARASPLTVVPSTTAGIGGLIVKLTARSGQGVAARSRAARASADFRRNNRRRAVAATRDAALLNELTQEQGGGR